MTDLNIAYEKIKEQEKYDLETEHGKTLEELRQTKEELQKLKFNQNVCPSCGCNFKSGRS